MSVLQTLRVRAAFVASRLRVVLGTTAGVAASYGAYQTLIGGNQYILREAKAESPSHTVQNPPIEDMEGMEDLPPPYEEPAAYSHCQPNLVIYDKAHVIFLWIKINPKADFKEVASQVCKLQEVAKGIDVPDDFPCGNEEINAGVGFSPDFYHQVKGDTPQPFSNDKHKLISSEPECGDILIHAKSNKLEKLKSLSKAVRAMLPNQSVEWLEESYVDGHSEHPETFAPSKRSNESKWNFRRPGSTPAYTPKHNHPVRKFKEGDHPDVLNYQYSEGELQLFPSEFVDEERNHLFFVKDSGSEDTQLKRKQAALDPETGGSYVMTQKWEHDVNMLDIYTDLEMYDKVTKSWKACTAPPMDKKFKPSPIDGTEVVDLSVDKWMEDSYQECLKAQKDHPDEGIMCSPGTVPAMPQRILRQCMPCENNGKPGVFFISCASTPKCNEMLLDRLIAASSGEGKLINTSGNVFKYSHNYRSSCWYFPGLPELNKIGGGKGHDGKAAKPKK